MIGIVTYSTVLFVTVSAFLLTLSLSDISLGEAGNAGFSVELIHRDSPHSPLFNSTESPHRRLTNVLQRSAQRVSRVNRSLASDVAGQTSILSGVGSYLMKLSIGTPPVEIYALADTANDFLWTPCKPCLGCEYLDPIFDPSASSTFRQVVCQENLCASIDGYYCISDVCAYERHSVAPLRGAIGTGFQIRGTVAMDTITLGSNRDQSFSIPGIVFGCFTSYVPKPYDTGAGVVGLGVGPNSLATQLHDFTGGKFSYCLVPIFSKQSGRMSFGKSAVLSGSDVVSTPLVLGSDPSISYLLTLEAISVGDVKLPFPGSPSSLRGNIVIDSGATLSYLPRKFLRRVESELDAKIYLRRADPYDDMRLCYEAFSDVDAPPITMHFTGADVKLSAANMFIRVLSTTVCFAFAPTQQNSFPFYGNLAQVNYLVAYDIQEGTVSFKQTDCSKY